jgi:AraC-like DNA-binding protein
MICFIFGSLMFYRQYTPHAALRSFIKCYWIMESDDLSFADHKEKILPDGSMEMVFHYHDLYRQFKKGKEKIQSRSLIVGQLKDYIEISPSGKAGMVAVRFHPHGAYPFIKIPMDEFTEEAVDLSLVLKDASTIQEMILNACSHSERISIIERFLLQQLSGIQTLDPRMNASLDLITRYHGNLSIKELSHRVNLSERQVERIFRTGVGLSPKTLSRIIRLQNSIQMIQQGQVKNLTDLAYCSGYFDQAHFIREFRSFAGVSPSNYFTENYQYATLFLSGND